MEEDVSTGLMIMNACARDRLPGGIAKINWIHVRLIDVIIMRSVHLRRILEISRAFAGSDIKEDCVTRMSMNAFSHRVEMVLLVSIRTGLIIVNVLKVMKGRIVLLIRMIAIHVS